MPFPAGSFDAGVEPHFGQEIIAIQTKVRRQRRRVTFDFHSFNGKRMIYPDFHTVKNDNPGLCNCPYSMIYD